MDKLSPFTIINPDANSDWLLICEHASNRVPGALKQLKLTESEFEKHIAYDIGAANMTKYLADKLNATAILGNYSRLVIDCNRSLTHPSCIPPTSDGVMIPANQQLTDEQRIWRIQQIYQPFHKAIFEILCQKMVKNPDTKIANIHSFTPMLAEEKAPRPWDIGFIHKDDELTHKVIQYFQTQTSYCIGDNEPYNGFIHKGYTVPAHADAMDIPSLLVEFRQDQINNPIGIKHWGNLLLSAIKSTTP